MLVATAGVAALAVGALVAAESGGDPWSILLQYGVLGLVTVLLMVGRRASIGLVPTWTLIEMQEERDAARAELSALRARIDERDQRAFTALTTALEDLRRATDAAVVRPRREEDR